MAYDNNIREEELKNKIAKDYFWSYDTTLIIGNIDFCVAMYQSNKDLADIENLLWAEAKKGSTNLYNAIVQLILTIGKARTFDKYLPPAFLGAFDSEKMAFVPYNEIHEVFYLNDFNWNVTPSNHNTKEFKHIYQKVNTIIDQKALLFYFEKDNKELRTFIKNNFVVGKLGLTKTQIDKNNFMVIYNKWLQAVKPTIGLKWDMLKKRVNIIDGDFFLADLLSSENLSLKEKLFVYLKKDHYELERSIDELGIFQLKRAFFVDNQIAHTQFWNKYERPPKEQYWDYIVARRDLLVPQDIRERKGSFYTPQIWVELSQRYLAEVLGENWQDEYYIWDCAAGTGNLLAGLTNKYHIWASTIDKQDVEVMKDRIQNGANLLEDHVFQFDFLNDDFSKLPKLLQDIINNPEKRKKLVVYINPPYAEATDGIGKGGKKIDVSKETATYKKYGDALKKAKNELFAQFFMRVYKEIDGCLLAEFSTLKLLNSPNFANFRKIFLAKLMNMFIVPAYTFDNVEGKFPISFMIWNTKDKETFSKHIASVYNEKGEIIQQKNIFVHNGKGYLNSWIKQYVKNTNGIDIGYLSYLGNDFQHSGEVRITSVKPKSHISTLVINKNTLLAACVYFAVRYCIKHTWLNNQDQFRHPNNEWEKDKVFQNDCLAYTLFNNKNIISVEHSTNHWIPFTEYEVNAREKFESNFMSQFLNGKLKIEENGNIYEGKKVKTTEKLVFSPEAKAVFEAGLALWQYYHTKPNINVNASLYDIRTYFQGSNDKGKMNSKSTDQTYNDLIARLQEALKVLAQKIAPKVYEYGFLKA